MICHDCRMIQHELCANIVDMFGNARPENVRANWCDCQHHQGNGKTTTDDTVRQNRDACITVAEGS